MLHAVDIFPAKIWRQRGKMSILEPQRKNKDARDLRQYSMLIAVPTILAAAPLIGFFIGQYADSKFGTDPYLAVVGVLFGFGAAGIEIGNLIKRSSAMEKDKDNEQ